MGSSFEKRREKHFPITIDDVYMQKTCKFKESFDFFKYQEVSPTAKKTTQIIVEIR